MNNKALNTKAGRKGDPRMHRAVNARLENPELSLFEALCIGGFEYPADEDASIVDCEKVTLGQRKNQLSRRIRLARKQQDEAKGIYHDGTASDGASASGNNIMDNVSSMINNGSGSAMGMGMDGLGRSGAQAALSANIKMQQQLMQRNKMNSGTKRNAQLAELGADAELMHLNDDGGSTADERDPRRMAKFHPQFQQLFVPRAASARNAFSNGGQLKGTPQLGGLSGPFNSLSAPSSSASFAAAAAAATNQGLLSSNSGLLGQHSLSQRLSNSGLASGVAVASLTNTANSVGLSLEQLAVALSSSSNLVKVLSNNSGTEQQLELALRLFRNESRALYQRCMLLAGFRPEDAEEKAQSHLQFAFSAWQTEGKRLQELMGEDMKNMNSGAAVATGMASNNHMNTNSQEQQLLEQEQKLLQQDQHLSASSDESSRHGHGHSHSHSHGHSHEHYVDGHHIHQLEGKCGHKAIIHQPKDGSAHIDFIVGDRVECYSGVQPVGNKSLSVWPSKYKCEDLRCPTPCAEKICELDMPLPLDMDAGKNTPKLLDLCDIDLDGAEWNSDLNGSMGTLLGLFKLGDSDEKAEESMQINGNGRDVVIDPSFQV